jgi:metal-responsive CopG/Arc/MetJ family transcriptional regulator
MRATLNIPDDLMKQVQAAAGERSKTRAIVKAMESYVQQKKMDVLRGLRGKIDIDFDWQEAENRELMVQEEQGKYRGR